MLSVLAAKLVQDRRAAAPVDRALVRRDKHVLVPLNPRRSVAPGAGALPAALALVPLALPTLPGLGCLGHVGCALRGQLLFPCPLALPRLQ